MKCVWCGNKINANYMRLYCSDRCKVAHHTKVKAINFNRKLEQNPDKVVKEILDSTVVKENDNPTNMEKMKERITRKYGLMEVIVQDNDPDAKFIGRGKILSEFMREVVDKISTLHDGTNFSLRFKEVMEARKVRSQLINYRISGKFSRNIIIKQDGLKVFIIKPKEMRV